MTQCTWLYSDIYVYSALHLDPYYISKKRRVLISEAQKALNISEQEVTAAIGPPNYDLIFHDIPMAQRKKAIELVENGNFEVLNNFYFIMYVLLISLSKKTSNLILLQVIPKFIYLFY